MTRQGSDDAETETGSEEYCSTESYRTACEGVVWIDVRQVRDWRKALVNMAMNLFLTSNVRNSLTTLRPGDAI